MMSKRFLVTAKYSAAGVKAVLSAGGTTRREAAEKMINDLGGNLECIYYMLNADEVFFICTLPDDLSMAAISLNIDATGMADINITPLLSPEQIDEAAAKVVHYRAPGQ
jgi:uncharacterized protein with GYD domain